MSVLSHLGSPTARWSHLLSGAVSRPIGRQFPVDLEADDTGERPVIDERIYLVQRLGAVIVGLTLLVFGLLGLASGVPFLSTEGERFLGLSANGALSVLSVVVATVLVGAAMRGPRLASTAMIALGVLFLLSALVNGALLSTSLNLLAFGISNVVFSVVVGLLLLFLGAYGRLSGNLPASSPYARPHDEVVEPRDLPSTPEEVAAEAAMRDAEIAVVEHRATEEQRRRVEAMARVRTRAQRRRVWMEIDQSTTGSVVGRFAEDAGTRVDESRRVA